MADTHETIADIIAEMRRGTRLPGYWRSCDVNKILQYHADRLEAAHKRELSKNVSKNGADFGQLGDAAKLREALRECAQYIACVGGIGVGEVTINDNVHLIPEELTQKAIAALAAPPRNCDVGDAADWEKRFGEECDKGHICSDCPVRYAKTRMAIELDKGARCEFVWAQMHYEEGGAK